MDEKIKRINKESIRNKYTRYDIESHTFIDPSNDNMCGGVPLMYDGKYLIVDSTDTHTLVYGSTGSLKTRTVVMPTIKVLCHAGESMIIHDSKAELYARLADELKQNGYKLVVIDLRNPEKGNAWNPLAIPYQFYLQNNIDKAAEFVNDIAVNLISEDISNKEPFWDYAAANAFYGLTMLLFRYCKEHDLPTDAVNISNLLTLRRKLFENEENLNPKLWNYACEDKLIAASLSSAATPAKSTRGGILAVLDQKLRIFALQPTLLNMMSNNDFDIESIGREKTAVFLITPDEKTSYHKLVSLFVKQSYEYIIYSAMKNRGGKVARRINFILDEFSSLPGIPDMSAMISAARSRDIRFLLVAQSKHQLIQRYGEDEAQTIIANATNMIFLTSRELPLLKDISELCGETGNHTPRVSVYELQHFTKEKCEALVLCGRLEPAIVNLLDIDSFGETSYRVLPIEKGVRKVIFDVSFEDIPDDTDNDVPDLSESSDETEDILKSINQITDMSAFDLSVPDDIYKTHISDSTNSENVEE